MVGGKYINFGFAVLLLLSMLASSGCVSTMYTHRIEDTKDLSQEQARTLLIETVKSFNYWCPNPTNVSATYKKIKYTCDGNSFSHRYSEYPVLIAKKVYGKPCVSDHGGETCLYAWDGEAGHVRARDMVRAWYVLSHADPVNPAQEAAFELAAKTYREAAIKPELTEEAVRRKVQAEAAVREKRFNDADALYEEALGVAPWWPAGHYNRGLILGEQKDYEEAIDELKRYLKVDPDAANARAVQLKIYEWEALVPQVAK